MNISFRSVTPYQSNTQKSRLSTVISDASKKDMNEKLKKNGIIVSGCTGLTIGAFGVCAMIHNKKPQNIKNIESKVKTLIH